MVEIRLNSWHHRQFRLTRACTLHKIMCVYGTVHLINIHVLSLIWIFSEQHPFVILFLFNIKKYAANFPKLCHPQTSHKYIKLHKSTQNIFLNITWHFPQIKTVTFWLISHMKFIAKMTEDPNSAVMHEIMCVQIDHVFWYNFQEPLVFEWSPHFLKFRGGSGAFRTPAFKSYR